MLKKFLVQQMMDNRPEEYQQMRERYKESVIKVVQPMIPRQQNYFDCGLYLLTYVELFLQSPALLTLKVDTSQPDLIDWFPKRLIIQKRSAIKQLITQL